MRSSCLLLSLAVYVTASLSRAFVPSSRTILSRLAKNAGKGIYQIEQEVQFKTEAEPLVLRERWIVENGDIMRLTVVGAAPAVGAATAPKDNYRFDAFYRDGKRQWSDGQQLRSSPESAEFIEPVLHFRSFGNLLGWLTRARLVPPGLGRERHFSKKSTPYSPEPGVRLGRSGGVVAWTFGEPSPAQASSLPGIWVDQDAFQFRRMRFPSQADVQGDHHSGYPGGLRLPRERTVAWDNNSVLIRVLSVKQMPDGAATRATLTSDGRVLPSRLPDAAQVREFYSRFR